MPSVRSSAGRRAGCADARPANGRRNVRPPELLSFRQPVRHHRIGAQQQKSRHRADTTRAADSAPGLPASAASPARPPRRGFRRLQWPPPRFPSDPSASGRLGRVDVGRDDHGVASSRRRAARRSPAPSAPSPRRPRPAAARRVPDGVSTTRWPHPALRRAGRVVIEHLADGQPRLRLARRRPGAASTGGRTAGTPA